MNDRGTPYGSYSESIPMEKLKKLITAKLDTRAGYTDKNVREYAEEIVESELGPSVASSENIVDALVKEILDDTDG